MKNFELSAIITVITLAIAIGFTAGLYAISEKCFQTTLSEDDKSGCGGFGTVLVIIFGTIFWIICTVFFCIVFAQYGSVALTGITTLVALIATIAIAYGLYEINNNWENNPDDTGGNFGTVLMGIFCTVSFFIFVILLVVFAIQLMNMNNKTISSGGGRTNYGY